MGKIHVWSVLRKVGEDKANAENIVLEEVSLLGICDGSWHLIHEHTW